MGKTHKDIWIDSVMDSTQGMVKAQPSADLFCKVERCVSGGISRALTVPLATVGLAAACIALLAAVNFYALTTDRTFRESAYRESKVEQVVAYYGLDENGINY